MLNIYTQFEDHKADIMDMLSDFQPIWGGNLGRINVVRHRIDLDPLDARQVTDPYGARPTVCKFEKRNIESMLKMGVIEPAQT